MKVDVVGPEAVAELGGVVVVIDVLRAFTTAAHAFAAGAARLLLVEAVEDALALRGRFPAARLVGEIEGYPIEGFDFGNSPSQIARHDLGGATLIQRTTCGTRAAIAARDASTLLASSFVCAGATVRHVLRLEPSHVALVLSGRRGSSAAADDLACADYLADLLRGERAEAAPFLARARDSSEARRFLDRDQAVFPIEDLELSLELDRFDFAMVARRQDGLLVLERTT